MPDNPQIPVAEMVLESAREAYSDVLESWKMLDGKAQTSMAVAGVFVAGVLAFLRDLSNTNKFEAILLVSAAVLLVGSALSALAVIRLRTFKHPPVGEDTYEKCVAAIEESGDDGAALSARIPHLYGQLARDWLKTVTEFRTELGRKTYWLTACQGLLTAAIGCVAAVVLLQVARVPFGWG